MTRLPGRLLLAVLVSGLVCGPLTGCGGQTATLPGRLEGNDVARMAERRLESENPRMAAGTMACPDLDFRVGASARCLRTTELSGGRVVKIAGTVTVTSRASGGRLHVAMDERAREFGLAGEQFVAGVRKLYRQRFGIEPRRLDCPYLRGAVGVRVTCRVDATGGRHDVDVVVTAVDPASFVTTYVLDLRGARG